MQHLDTQLARHHFDVLQAEINERRLAVEQLRTEIETGSENVLLGENEIARLREEAAALDQEINQSQQRALELKGQIEKHESRLQFNQERLHELEAQNAKALSDITQADERRLAGEQELAGVSERLTASAAALEAHRADLDAKQQMLQALERDLEAREETLCATQAEAFATAQQLTRVRNEINALDLQKQGNVVRLEKLSSEKIQLEEERARLEARLHEFAVNVEAEKLGCQTHRGTVEERQKRLREIDHELSEAALQLDDHLRQQAEKRTRLSVLEQLQESHEGFSTGALAALEQSKPVLGSLADKVRVRDQFVTAIETALGHNLQLVLTEQTEAAKQIIAELTAKKKGRASIAPLELLRGETQNNGHDGPARAADLPSPEVALDSQLPMPAINVVEADPAVRPLLERLLGMTRIVPDLAAATAAWRETHGAFHYVTLDGELLSRHGVYSGGSSNGSVKTPASILGRKNQIVELQSQLAQFQERINTASRRKGTLLSEQTQLQAGLQQAQTELRTQEVAIATHQGEFNALENSQRVLHQKIDTVVYEIQSLSEHEREGAQRRASLAAQIGEHESQERVQQQQLAALNAEMDRLRRQRDEANAALTEARVAFATDEQLCASFRAQQKPLTGRIEELKQLVQQRRSEVSSFINRKAQAEAEMEDSRRQIESLQQEREQVNAHTAELLSQRESGEGGIATREDNLREQRRRLTDLQQRRGALDVELAQKNMSVQNLRDRIQQQYHFNLDEVRSECITITFADEGPAKVQTLTPEEMAASGVSTDWNAVTDQVTALHKRVEEIGPVNLVAIEEYEETEQRFEFLTKQNDDLVKAREQLMEVINRINVQTKEMFTDTFHKVRDNFRSMFTEVFGGGKADLILVNEGDVLESGIDIVARPPGKQLQTISLLSGGEQTMTAVALLFAIYQVKPSPFCVLDELDAPLDESNINRFVRMLQRFLVHSQFVIITHNKRTIGMADVLYGVTMEEQGISKIVSVKFHKAEELATDHTPVSLERPTPGTSVEEEEDEPHKQEETLEIVMAK